MTPAASPTRSAAAVVWLVGFLTVSFAVSCVSGGGRTDAGDPKGWAAGPVRWLMLPSEARQFRRLESAREILAFVEAFWLRRDPDLSSPGNPRLRQFYERVDAADGLYGEDQKAGSLTPRGRALILLGSPPVLRTSQREVPALETRPSSPRPVVTSRSIQVESWTYGPDDLSAELLALLTAEGRTEAIVLSFGVEESRSSLLEGESLLELAARAWLREADAL
jgi:GWxTD domain-containing protein